MAGSTHAVVRCKSNQINLRYICACLRLCAAQVPLRQLLEEKGSADEGEGLWPALASLAQLESSLGQL